MANRRDLLTGVSSEVLETLGSGRNIKHHLVFVMLTHRLHKKSAIQLVDCHYLTLTLYDSCKLSQNQLSKQLIS